MAFALWLRRDGRLVTRFSMDVPGGFSDQLCNLGVSMVGDWITSGRHQVSYIDNVSFNSLVLILAEENGGSPHLGALNVTSHVNEYDPLQTRIDNILNGQDTFVVVHHPSHNVLDKRLNVSISTLRAIDDHLYTTDGRGHRWGLEVLNSGANNCFDKRDDLWTYGSGDPKTSPGDQDVWGISSDDGHGDQWFPEDRRWLAPYGRGFIVLRAAGLGKQAVLDALRQGSFSGVSSASAAAISDIAVVRQTITVRLSRQMSVFFTGQRHRPLRGQQEGLSATYRVRGNEGYVRILVSDQLGHFAFTQPMRVSRDAAGNIRVNNPYAGTEAFEWRKGNLHCHTAKSDGEL